MSWSRFGYTTELGELEERVSILETRGTITTPSSSTDNAISRFDGTTGRAVQSSTVTVNDDGDVDTDGTLTVDTIGEHTAAAGVTIDGVELKDGSVFATGGAIPLRIKDGVRECRAVDNGDGIVWSSGTTGTMGISYSPVWNYGGSNAAAIKCQSGKVYGYISASIKTETNSSGFIVNGIADITSTTASTTTTTGALTVAGGAGIAGAVNAGAITGASLVSLGGIASVSDATINGSVRTDTIAEITLNNGVDIDGVNVKDGGITLSGTIDGVFNLEEETLSALGALSLTVPVSRISFNSGHTTPQIESGSLGMTLAAGTQGQQKTVILSEGYADVITIFVLNSSGDYYHYALSPTNHIITLMYDGGAWRDISDFKGDIYLDINELSVNESSATYRTQISRDGKRFCLMTGDGTDANRKYIDIYTVEGSDIVLEQQIDVSSDIFTNTYVITSHWNSLTMNNAGDTIAVHNSGDVVAVEGEIAIFRRSGSTWTHEETHTGGTAELFGYLISLADNNMLLTSDADSFYLYRLGASSLTLLDTYASASNNSICELCGDGRYGMLWDATNSDVVFFSTANDSFDVLSTTATASISEAKWDQFGYTCAVGRNSPTPGRIYIFNRRNNVYTSDQTLIGTSSNAVFGNTNYYGLTDDGNNICFADRNYFGFYEREKFGDAFAYSVNRTGGLNYNSANINGDGSLALICRQTFPANNQQFRIYQKQPNHTADLTEYTLTKHITADDAYIKNDLTVDGNVISSTAPTLGSHLVNKTYADSNGAAEDTTAATFNSITNLSANTIVSSNRKTYANSIVWRYEISATITASSTLTATTIQLPTPALSPLPSLKACGVSSWSIDVSPALHSGVSATTIDSGGGNAYLSMSFTSPASTAGETVIIVIEGSI